MTTPAAPRRSIGRVELTALLAMSMALGALGIDAMLPAFADIRSSLGLPEGATAVTGLVTTYFLGLAVGTLVYGPLSDRFGRRPALYAGFAIYALGAAAATMAGTLPLLLAARFVWGVGAAGPRVVTLAVVRDRYSGEQMSRVMSFILAVFILVPIVAPTFGAAIVAVASWRWIFGACLLGAVAVAAWSLRLPETLHEEHRRDLRVGPQVRAVREVVSNRETVAYGLGMTVLYGAFTSYIGSAELIFGSTFDQRAAFPVIFGGLAAVMGVAMATNGRIVERVGTRRLAHVVMAGYVAVSAGLVAIATATGGRPPLWLWLVGMAAMLASHALLIPNFSSLAMQPMGRIAGTASSIVGAVQLAGGALLGAVIDQAFDGTVRPLAVGFLIGGLVTLGLLLWGEGGRLRLRAAVPAPVAAAASAEPELT